MNENWCGFCDLPCWLRVPVGQRRYHLLSVGDNIWVRHALPIRGYRQTELCTTTPRAAVATAATTTATATEDTVYGDGTSTETLPMTILWRNNIHTHTQTDEFTYTRHRYGCSNNSCNSNSSGQCRSRAGQSDNW